MSDFVFDMISFLKEYGFKAIIFEDSNLVVLTENDETMEIVEFVSNSPTRIAMQKLEDRAAGYYTNFAFTIS